MLTAEPPAKMQAYSTSDLIGGRPVLLILVALISFTLGTFFGHSLEINWQTQKPTGNVQGRFGAANWAKPIENPK